PDCPLARALRDHNADDFDEIWVDDQPTLDYARGLMDAVHPGCASKAQLYEGATPLFEEHGLSQESTQRTALPSSSAARPSVAAPGPTVPPVPSGGRSDNHS